MQKEIKFIIGVFILFIIVFAISVIAAGISEGGDVRNTSSVNNTNNTSGNNNESINRTRDDDREDNETDDDGNETGEGNRSGKGRQEYQKRNCEEFEKEKDRIRCRIIQGENYTAPEGNIPEACRLNNTEIKGRCVAFYATIQTCYKLPPKAKDACFRRASGLTKKFDEESQEGRKGKARNYMITLLYELEQRVEKAHLKEKISDDAATNLVDEIVQIKKAILEGKSKEEIKTMLKNLKETWKISKTKIDSATAEGEGNE